MTESVNQRHQPISKSVIQQTERKKERKKETMTESVNQRHQPISKSVIQQTETNHRSLLYTLKCLSYQLVSLSQSLLDQGKGHRSDTSKTSTPLTVV